MPAVSKAQQRWAYWAEKHPKAAGVSVKVAREFQHTAGKVPERKGDGQTDYAAALKKLTRKT